MPGPGNKKNKSKQQRPQPIAAQSNTPKSSDPPKAKPRIIIACQTLDEDEITRCGQPATEGYPTPERCRVHYAQYRTMCKKYKDASKVVDEIKQGGEIPGKDAIARYTNVSQLLEKSRLVKKYVEAIRIERTGRDIHSRRFFLKVDSGHKIRIKVLAKEMIRGVEAIDALQAKAYLLHTQANPLPSWAQTENSELPPMFSAENMINISESKEAPTPGAGRRLIKPAEGSEAEDQDLVDLELRAMKDKLLQGFEFFLGPHAMEDYILKSSTVGGDSRSSFHADELRHSALVAHRIYQQYARRIVFHEPTLFMKALGKVSFKDFIMSDDFDMVDAARFARLFSESLGFGLLWFKDAVQEGLVASRPRASGAEANLNDRENRFEILGGWIYNVPHKGTFSNEGWFRLLHVLEPPANVENRFVRLCNNFDDMISFLSFGALGKIPSPSTCAKAVPYRNHLSLSGVVITEMIGDEKPPQLLGPVPTKRPARTRGCITWAEFESRAYMFGAIRHEPSAFNDAFLAELKARPDLFQVIIRSETDPGRTVETFGAPLPQVRARNFEAPFSLHSRPAGNGDWMIARTALDIIYSTDEKCLGYLTILERGGSMAKGWFFRFKKFNVKYIVILDAVPNRSYEHLAKNVAWAALKAQGYGTGDYEERKYALASDKFFDKHAHERLSFMPESMKGSWSTTKMADQL